MTGPSPTTHDLLARAEQLVPQLAARAAEYDRTGEFPAASIVDLHEAGLLTATVGARWGGAGLNHEGVHRLLLTLGRGDPGVALIASMTLLWHHAEALAPKLPEALYRRILDESATRPTLVNALQVEPELGTPSRGGRPATTARRVPDGWTLRGHKVFSTGAAGLRWMVVLAATDEPEPRIGNFFVEAGGLDGEVPGVEVVPTWSAAGMRSSASDDVVFTDVFVPEDRVVNLRPVTHEVANPGGPGTAITSIYLGVASAALDWLVGFLHSRLPTNLGHPLVDLPRFQWELGELELRLQTAIELTRGLAARADAGDPPSRELAFAGKVQASRAAIEVVERAVGLIGNPGLSRDNPLERHLRDVMCARVHFPQEDTVVSILGRAAAARSSAPDQRLRTAVHLPARSPGSR